ncbi:MAG: hypothetical protein LBP67_02430 [Bacteroidales bacterium]|jgi:3-phosphoshikimate 1-carboxyvinyltransferase|nr:hypothetical protein [Bacteroidales bacterium]
MPNNITISESIDLPINKSILNRYLILKYLYDDLSNVSLDSGTPDDSILLYNILKEDIPDFCNCMNAGTVFRFILAVSSLSGKSRIIDGSERMRERPCKDLVDSLELLGAKIEYLDKVGYPPVRIISPINLNNYPETIFVKSDISSQFVSAIMMIAPLLPLGLNIELCEQNVSHSYIVMTSEIMNNVGLKTVFNDNLIYVLSQTDKVMFDDFIFEKDWSAAAFWVTILSAFEKGSVELKGLTTKSVQGDKVILDYLHYLNIDYIENDNSIILSKSGIRIIEKPDKVVKIDLKNSPDLFPPLAVAFALSDVEVHFTGLNNLIWKESNRIVSVLDNLKLLSYDVVQLSDDDVIIYRSINDISNINKKIMIKTHDDHRIAMAFAVFEYLNDNIEIDNMDCVTKSYPGFSVGFLNK